MGLARSGNGVERPHELSSPQIPRAHGTVRPQTGSLLRMLTGDGQVAIDCRRRGQRDAKLRKFLPEPLPQIHFAARSEFRGERASLGVERDQEPGGVARTEYEPRPDSIGARPIRNTADRRRVPDVGHPDLFAGVSVERGYAIVGSAYVHHTIDDERRGRRLPRGRTRWCVGGGPTGARRCALFRRRRGICGRLGARRRAARGRYRNRRVVGPYQLQLRHVAGVDLFQR